MPQQIDYDIGHLGRGDLPVGALRGIALRELGGDRSRQHVADPDVVVAQLLHQRFAERVQARLRRAVRGAVRKGVGAGQAADVDDVAAAAPPQVWNRRVTRVEDTGEVRVDDFGPLRGGHLRDVGKNADARVVHEDVEAAEAPDGRGDGALDLFRLADVGAKRLDGARPGAFNLRPRGRQRGVTQSRHRNRHAVGHERAGDGQADAARSARHQGDLATYGVHVTHYNSAREMDQVAARVAIVGGGELGGLLAHVLARRNIAHDICLIDDNGRVAQGKALDIAQAAPVEGSAST